jgi:ABC-type methionine transport system ATPase subunit
MAISSNQVRPTTDELFQQRRRTQTRIQVCIPKHLYREPVISRLISLYGVTVNITAAQLDSRLPQEGYFDLDIGGTVYQIESAMSYLTKLNVDIWYQSTIEEDGW